jgi:hypothetical protein
VRIEKLNSGLGANSFHCGYCLPGYKPVPIANTPYVSACEEIDNCENSVLVNACSACKTNYAFEYKKTGTEHEILYNSCVLMEPVVSNCFAYG